MRNISLDLIRVTEAGAISASNWVGYGDKQQADKAATTAIRHRLNNMNFSGEIIIGEGEKDKSHGLFRGEIVGELAREAKKIPSSASEAKVFSNLRPTLYQIAIDPIDGTTPTVNSGPGAISVMAVSEERSFAQIATYYMAKLVVGPKLRNVVDITMPIGVMIQKASSYLCKSPDRITVCLLNRERHKFLAAQLRELGVRLKLIEHCDIEAAIETCLPNSNVDIYLGIGGSPEGIITAAAVKCLNGFMQCMPIEGNASEVKNKYYNNYVWDRNKIYKTDELVKKDCVFVATGITDGGLLDGVKIENGKYVTNSVFMRSNSNTTRWLTTKHGN